MSEIDYGRLRSLTARELIHALLEEGFFSLASGAATTATTTLMVGGSPSHSPDEATPLQAVL